MSGIEKKGEIQKEMSMYINRNVSEGKVSITKKKRLFFHTIFHKKKLNHRKFAKINIAKNTIFLRTYFTLC